MKYHKLVENAGRPKGFWGNLMINSMNKGHYEVTGWGLSFIDIDKNSRVLDIGCGGGRTVQRIAEKVGNGKVYGIDYSELCVKKSEKLNRKNILCGKVRIQQASVSALPFEDESIDIATAVETYYFWSNKLSDLKEIHRVLRKGGRLCMIFEMLRTEDEPDKWKSVEELIGIKSVSENEIRSILQEAGYVNIKTHTMEGTSWLCAVAEKEQTE